MASRQLPHGITAVSWRQFTTILLILAHLPSTWKDAVPQLQWVVVGDSESSQSHRIPSPMIPSRLTSTSLDTHHLEFMWAFRDRVITHAKWLRIVVQGLWRVYPALLKHDASQPWWSSYRIGSAITFGTRFLRQWVGDSWRLAFVTKTNGRFGKEIEGLSTCHHHSACTLVSCVCLELLLGYTNFTTCSVAHL